MEFKLTQQSRCHAYGFKVVNEFKILSPLWSICVVRSLNSPLTYRLLLKISLIFNIHIQQHSKGNSRIIITLSPIYSCSYNDEKTRWRNKHLSAHIATNFGELSKESPAAWSGHVGGLSNNIDSIPERIKSSRQQRFSVVHGCSGFMVRWVSTFHFQLHSMSMSIHKLLVKHSMTLFSPPLTQPASLSYSNRSEVWPAVLYSSRWVVNVRWFS